MDIVITESQYKNIISESNTRFRRYYPQIQSYFKKKSLVYTPCNYNYEGGDFDFFADIRSVTIEWFLDKSYGIVWNEVTNEEYFDLYDTLSDMILETEYQNTKSYYDKSIKENCPNKIF